MVRPDITIVTAIASDHWKSLGTLEQTRNEKAEMVHALSPSGVAILNADDANVRWMATQTTARVVLVGESEDADFRATDVRLDWPHGMRFNAVFDGRSIPVRTRLVGRHLVFSILAASAVAQIEGTPLDGALSALEGLEPTLSRMQPVPLPSGAIVIRDDYKAGLESFATAMSTLAEIPAQRRIAVIGPLSESHGRDDYRAVGAMVGAVADRVVLVGHSDDLKVYRSALVKSENIQRVRTAHEAAQLLEPELRTGDVVLTKSRWQQALPRVALELMGRDVKCRADPCPFTRMMCDLCPYLERPFDGRGFSPLARPRWSPQASGQERP
jgi:UDP-N-acetylmuramoyl-tripeptide--D-alanyl-D-alanine ligase